MKKKDGKSAHSYTKKAVQSDRNYKDRVFRMIFKEKRASLELYNAINGTAYDRPEDLIVTTLENAVYLGMKNDVSFLIYDELSLYEHQSTVNPNMPLRDLLYVADIYSGLTKEENLHGTKQIRLPAPSFIVFYNGTDPMPEKMTLRLSDSFEKTMEEPNLELKTLVLNINPGYNPELMEKCRPLYEYMIFVSRIRSLNRVLPLEQAVEQAVNACIDEGILADFLRKNKAEVQKVSIYEYNEEWHIQKEREYAMELGMEKGQDVKTITIIQKMLRKGISVEEIIDMLEEPEVMVREICKLVRENPELKPEALYDFLKNKQILD